MTVLILLWIIAVPALFLVAVLDLISFSSQAPNPHQTRGGVLVLTACTLAVLLPAAATVVGHRDQRPLGTMICGVLTVAGLLVALLSVRGGLEATGLVADTPSRTHHSPVSTGNCADRSGGEATCPGG